MTNVKHPAATAAAARIAFRFGYTDMGKYTRAAQLEIANIITEEMLRAEAELDAAQAHRIEAEDLWLYGEALAPEPETELMQHYSKDERK